MLFTGAGGEWDPDTTPLLQSLVGVYSFKSFSVLSHQFYSDKPLTVGEDHIIL